MIIFLVGFLVFGGSVNEQSDFETIELYRTALNSHNIETAMSFLAEDYKLRFVGTEFVISKVGLPGIWGWDAGVNGHVEWDLAKGKAAPLTFEGREKNDFFDLLGIARLRFTTTFRIDVNGKIIEQLYEIHPGQPSWEEAMKAVVEWASRHRPAELQGIYPNSQMIYTEKMARRWVALLKEWKSSRSE